MGKEFDIKKAKVVRQTIADLPALRKKFFRNIFLGGFLFALVVKLIIFYGIHFSMTSAKTSFTNPLFLLGLQSTTPARHIADTGIIALLISIYFINALFRERGDYVTINAWYFLVSAFVGLTAVTYYFLPEEIPILFLYSVLLGFGAIQITQLIQFVFKD